MPESPDAVVGISTSRFALTPAQLQRMQWAQYQWNVVLMAVLLVGMGVVAFRVQREPGVFLVVFAILLLYLVVTRMSLSRYAKGEATAPLRLPRTHLFDHSGITTTLGSGATSQTPWAQVDRVKVYRGFWLIRYTSGASHPFPMDAVAPADVPRLEQLLRAKQVLR